MSQVYLDSVNRYYVLMKLISWNVNGIRAVDRKKQFDWWVAEQPDFMCLQEIKATFEQIPSHVREIPGYFSYFNSPREKKGYSGVAIYTRHKPLSVSYEMNSADHETEGRMITLEYADYCVINIYFPNGGGGPERLAYKLAFYDAFILYIEKLRKSGKKIIFCGDVNTAHEEIDLARPKQNEENTGFLPEERAWIDEVINHGYIDTFRFLNPGAKEKYTYWDMKTAARERNIGWRIDYFFISQDLQKFLKEAFILEKIYGSDHCPLGIVLSDFSK